MRKIKLTLAMGILATLTLTPSCSKSGGSSPLLALASVVDWTSTAAQYLVPRHSSFPRDVQEITLRHNGQVGDIEFDLKDPSGILQATPASGVLRPGQQVTITVAILALINYKTEELLMTCRYAGALSTEVLVVPFRFALMPPGMYVMSLLSASDPVIQNLFELALLLGLVGAIVRHMGMNRKADHAPILRFTEIILMGMLTLPMASFQLQSNFWRSKTEPESNVDVNFPPGQGAIGYTLHPDMEVDMVPGEFHAFHSWMQLGGVIPIKDPEPKNRHTYAIVLDSDGSSTNNWKARAGYPNDFWQGTDRWYEVRYNQKDTPGVWSFRVWQVDATGKKFTQVASAARAIIVEDAIVLVVPKSEIPGPSATWRTTTFVHQTDDLGETSPFLWSGDVEPAIGKPMHPVK